MRARAAIRRTRVATTLVTLLLALTAGAGPESAAMAQGTAGTRTETADRPLTANAAEESVPITDPTLLDRLGFSPDTTNVYATPEAFERLLMSPAERAAAQAATVEARREEVRSGGDALAPFGTADVGYSSINVGGFQPGQLDSNLALGIGASCIQGTTPGIVFAELEGLPHGAKLEQVDIRYTDQVEGGLEVDLFRICYPDIDGDPTLLLLGMFASEGNADFVRFASIGPLDQDIDAQSCFYGAQISFPGPCPVGGPLGVTQLRAQWRRQVSPPPATATFDDVPTSHPFFQHVEALVASGVTSGCGDDDFCPNDSLTRGQMAVFLAKALGLHWE